MEGEKKIFGVVVAALIMSTGSLVLSAAGILSSGSSVLRSEEPVLTTTLIAQWAGPSSVKMTGTINDYGHYGALVVLNFTIIDGRGASLASGIDLGWIAPEGGTKTIDKTYAWPASYLTADQGNISLRVDYVLHWTRPG